MIEKALVWFVGLFEERLFEVILRMLGNRGKGLSPCAEDFLSSYYFSNRLHKPLTSSAGDPLGRASLDDRASLVPRVSLGTTAWNSNEHAREMGLVGLLQRLSHCLFLG
jgi:hypothetical protein